ncbi:unnamed protein product [Cylindrotheca closterium]|uniref:Uncharacterized protein n=1 Tax=Cylindrotheca closterium TaxID=2856 RepID=A0AAD2CST4_9STRA|nr:unnamed protein product [Cylindrotheca closterium]
MTETTFSQNIHSGRIPEVLHQHGIWRRPTMRPGSMDSLRRFSFAQQDIENSKAKQQIYNEDNSLESEFLPLVIILDDDELLQESSDESSSVPPSPPMSVWSCSMSSNQSEHFSVGFALCDPKNLRFYRDSNSTVTPSVRDSINTTSADYGLSVATSDSDSSMSQEEEVYSELLSICSDIPREIVVRKTLSQRFPFLRRLAPKLLRQSNRNLEL